MKNRITICLAIIAVILMAACVFEYMNQDHIPPEILVPESDMTYVEGQDNSALLIGVSATDNKDDNLSTDVRIYDIAVLDNGTQALVTYAVYDSSNNLGKATKLVEYIHDDTMEAVQVGDNDKDKASASRDEASDKDKESDDEAEEVEEGYDDPELVSDGDPVIRLVTHEVHIEVGDEFYDMDYVEDAVDDIDGKGYLFRNMYQESDYDEDTPGEYELTYYCEDSDGNRSNEAKLMLYVEDD